MEEKQKLSSQAAIQFLSGPLVDKIILIEKAETVIGRDRQNDVVVLDPKVSRQHARILSQHGSWTIENLSQHSFISINDQRLERRGTLQHNSMVGLGEDTRFLFLVRQAEAGQQTSQYTPAQQSPIPSTVGAVPMSKVINMPSHISPSGTALAPMSELGMPSLTVSSNVHSDRQCHCPFCFLVAA